MVTYARFVSRAKEKAAVEPNKRLVSLRLLRSHMSLVLL